MKMFLGLVMLLPFVAVGEANDWENTAVNSRNREPVRTYSLPLADEASAFVDALEPVSPYVLSLNGNWKFNWTGDPVLREKDFWQVDYDDSTWFEIDVPSCVEMRGFGNPHYVNVAYPHANEAPRILDRAFGSPDYNPVSSYRRTFSVPEEWKGREVYLRFDGVYSAYYVWVNGQSVGYAEDSCLPSEFNITPFLNHEPQAENVLCVEVYRWCDGSYLEDQDMFRFSGIFRDVTLWSMPKDGIWDFTVRTRPIDGYERWRIAVEVEKRGEGEQRIEVSLYDEEKNKIGDLHSQPLTSTFDLELTPRLWSAEEPYLYTLIIRKGDDIRMKRIGFKDVRIQDHTILVNGRSVKFKGVNRHDCHPENGKTVSLADMERDIRMFKQNNINTVRTAHYPNHHLWYDLCDRYGIYVCAEANVEGHEPGLGDGGLGNRPEWFDTIVERNVRQVGFYRNHPSIIFWSLGNETGSGEGFRRAAAAVKQLDPSRLTHWNCGNDLVDVDSTFYRPIDWLEDRGVIGDDEKDSSHQGHFRGKVLFMCEYAHAMGNALGNFKEYWDVFYRHRSLSGGCIWDWADQAVWKKDGQGGRFLAYGGDWDDKPNDGSFCNNGLVTPLREPSAKLAEVKYVHRNLVVEQTVVHDDIRWTLWNRYVFTSADRFTGRWRLRKNGGVISEAAFAVPAIGPLSRGELTLPDLSAALSAEKGTAELFVEFSFALKEATRWAPAGYEIAADQIKVSGDWWKRQELEVQKSSEGVAVSVRNGRVVVSAGETMAEFSREAGTLTRLMIAGLPVLSERDGVGVGPRLTCLRSFTDNDTWLLDKRTKILDYGLSHLHYHARPLKVLPDGVVCTVEVTGSKSAGFTHIATWRFAADGSVRVTNEVTPHGKMPPVLPRLGTSWILDPALEDVTWYGRGPHENYIDRQASAFVSLWQSTVTGLAEDYVRPQDNGYRGDVRFVTFRRTDGSGVRFQADRPLFVQALHHSCEDLTLARHRSGEPRRRAPLATRPEIYLNLDIRQLGLGNASCGPVTLPEYCFPVQNEIWTLTLEPLKAN